MKPHIDIDAAFADQHLRDVYKTGRLDGIREVIAFLRGGMMQNNRAVWNKGDCDAAERFADRIAHEVARTMCARCVERGQATLGQDGTFVHHKEALGLPQVSPCDATKWLESLPPGDDRWT